MIEGDAKCYDRVWAAALYFIDFKALRSDKKTHLSRLKKCRTFVPTRARVAELVDALVSNTNGVTSVPVRSRFRAHEGRASLDTMVLGGSLFALMYVGSFFGTFVRVKLQ